MKKWVTTDGEAMAAIRNLNGISQRELAKKVKVSNAAISYLENGTREPSFELATKIAKTLGVPMRTIFTVHEPH